MSLPERRHESRTSRTPVSSHESESVGQPEATSRFASELDAKKIASVIGGLVLRLLLNVCIRWPYLLFRELWTSHDAKVLRELKAMRKMMADDQRQKQSKESDQQS